MVNSHEAKRFWAEYAAVDVLNISNNEGRLFNGNLEVLLTGGESFPIPQGRELAGMGC